MNKSTADDITNKVENNRVLPRGWRWVKLGEVGSFDSGGTPSKQNANYWGGHIPFVTGADITELYISSRHARVFLTEEGFKSGKTAVCNKGTILFVTRTRVGRVGIAFEVMGASQDLSPYTCDSKLLPEYACRYLLSISDSLVENCRGATIQGLTRDFIRCIKIPLPPLPEQKRIAAILNEQMTAVEKARAAAEAQLAAAKALPAAYLRQVLPKPGQELPSGWHWVRLGEYSDLLPSKSIASDGEIEVQAITTACLTELGFNPLGIKTARMWAKDIQECTVSAGEVLIARSNTPELVGRVAMFEGTPIGVIASDLTIRVRTRRDLESEYLARFLAALFVRDYWRKHAGGASGTMKKITRTQVKALQIPICALSEQKRIAARLSEQMKSAEHLEKNIEDQLDTVNKLPAAILKRAFNGEL